MTSTKFGIDTFIKAISLKRSHQSDGELDFVNYLMSILPNPQMDAIGNIHVDLRNDLTINRTLFTAHTDTVHRSSNSTGIITFGKKKNKKNKRLITNTNTKVNYYDYDAEKNHIIASGDVLGADDASGIAILVAMIQANVSGYYIFFRGEERGGIGSSWLAKNNVKLLQQFDRAIAFDRAGYYDVITHQGFTRCCSDIFGQSLADALSTDFHWFVPSDGGVYTDTAEFVEIIPECTNISVGYFLQHSTNEYQDMTFLEFLIDKAISVDWDGLPTDRDPTKIENSKWGDSYGFASYYQDPVGASNSPLFNDIKDYAMHDTISSAELYYALDRATRGDNKQLEDLMYDYTRIVDSNIMLKDMQIRNLSKTLIRDAMTSLDSDNTSSNACRILDDLFYECYTGCLY